MPVLKVYKNGAWEELGGTSPMDGGNADTLDGKHASEFASVDAVNELETKTIYGFEQVASSFEQVASGFEYFDNQIGDDTVAKQIENALVNFSSKTLPEEINNALANHYTYSTIDLEAGSSQLATGKLYFVYE